MEVADSFEILVYKITRFYSPEENNVQRHCRPMDSNSLEVNAVQKSAFGMNRVHSKKKKSSTRRDFKNV
jgi:hypothetical protein